MGVNGKIRIGTIGTGKIVRRFLAGIAKCPLIEYQAVYSRSEEKAKDFAAEYGVEKYYTTLEGLAQDPDIDGVYIASPNFLHCEQAVFLMEHGKHVLVENLWQVMKENWKGCSRLPKETMWYFWKPCVRFLHLAIR